MFKSDLNRSQFFWLSSLSQLIEIVLVILAIVMTLGFDGLINSRPGPGREGFAGAILVFGLFVALMRCNLALRRSRDADGSRFQLGTYMVFTVLFAVLQAGEFLVYDFNGDTDNAGLGLLGLSLIVLWTLIWRAPSVGGGAGPVELRASGSRFKSEEKPAGGLLALNDTDFLARANALRAADAAKSVPSPASMSHSGNRPVSGSFGRRGLA